MSTAINTNPFSPFASKSKGNVFLGFVGYCFFGERDILDNAVKVANY